MSDGAAAVLVMTREEANKRGLPILGVIRAYAVKGCAPDEMGIGPAVAIPLALEKAGMFQFKQKKIWVGRGVL